MFQKRKSRRENYYWRQLWNKVCFRICFRNYQAAKVECLFSVLSKEFETFPILNIPNTWKQQGQTDKAQQLDETVIMNFRRYFEL